MEWVGALVRLVVSALVLMFVGAILPGFEPLGFWNALLAAAVIAAVGWVVEATMGKNISPYSRGIVGFLVSAIIIWAAQYVVPDMSVSILGALLAAFVIGIIDLFVPTSIR
ncbi:MAG: phage holin family protein [Firmicutes bacterium]|nr:phage holin family protein [Bacillota bacterium]